MPKSKKPPIAFQQAIADAYEYFASCGRKGGYALARKLTPAERSASARHAVQARWARYRAEQKQAEREARS